jgi:DNA-binding FadR family transcriptional regulator
MPEDRRVAAALRHVAQPRAHEYVAEQLRRLILLRVAAPGDRLPYEQELAALLGVSRATVTQALRRLEQEGLVNVRRGRGGGVFTRRVSTDGDDPAVVSELRGTRDAIVAAAEARAIVEPSLAMLAASRVTHEALARLAGLNDELAAAQGDDHRFMRADTAFHLVVAEASRNVLLLDTVERSRLTLARALEALPDSRAWHARSVSQHGRVLAAIRAGEADAARQAMADHVEESNRAVRLMLATLHP